MTGSAGTERNSLALSTMCLVATESCPTGAPTAAGRLAQQSLSLPLFFTQDAAPKDDGRAVFGLPSWQGREKVTQSSELSVEIGKFGEFFSSIGVTDKQKAVWSMTVF